MKAATYTKYGPPEVIQIRDVEIPTPKHDEVLIKVYATTVNRTDTGCRSVQYFVSRFFTGLFRPKQPVGGSEFAGEIIEVGMNISDYKIGDRVFGFDDVHGGDHAEFMVKKTTGAFATIPVRFSYLKAAPAGEGATYALNGIQASGVKKAQKVLVYGATGAIGSAAVQILKFMGANVTAIYGTNNIKLVKRLGADEVLDYQTQDWSQINDKFNFIFDAVGKSSFGVCKKLLTTDGKYCSTELGRYGQNPILAIWFALTGSRKVIFPIPKINKNNLEYLKHLMEIGAYKPVIDRTYDLNDIVEATKYVETGQKTGNVVIKVV